MRALPQTLRRLPGPALQALLALAYLATALLGGLLTLPVADVPLVWPAAGLALVAAFRLGYRYLIGIGIGAFAFYLLASRQAMPSLALAIGGVAGAGLGAALLRYGEVEPGLSRLRDVLWLTAAVAAAAILSAAIESATVYRAGLSPWQGWRSLWWLYWVADTVGGLLLAPLLLTLRAARMPEHWRGPAERTALAAAVLAVSWLVYADVLPQGVAMALPLSYVVFPLLIWGAMRHDPRQVALLLLLHAAVAIAYTAGHHGPFATGDVRQSLLSLHTHLSMLGISMLIMAAAMAERRQSEARARQHLQELAHVGRIGALGEMAEGLAHELNQPLCAITNYSQATLRLLPPDIDPELRNAMERVAANARRAGGIISQMRDFVRKDEQLQRPADINRLIEEVTTLARSDARHHGVHLELALGPALPPVEVAAIQIQQVLVNLVRNAIEAMRESASRERRIRIHSRRFGGQIEVGVSDTGPGLPPGLLDQVFHPFVSTKAGGMGLGLSISRSIIEAHGGTLTAHGRTGGGTEFRFTLPAARTRHAKAG